MIPEFEQRLADTLSARLPAPFTGRVVVAPGSGPVTDTRIVLGARRVSRVEPDFGVTRPVIVPGSTDERRVLRLRCIVSMIVQPGSTANRLELIQARDAALYELEAPDFQDGRALTSTGDPGFLIQEMRVIDSEAPIDPGAPNAPPVGLDLGAEGWFWPVGVPGVTGIPIGEIRLRGVVVPIEVTPAAPDPIAGGAPIDLTLNLHARGTMRLDGGAPPPPPLPFGNLAVALFDPGGRPGAGTLSGGSAGVTGVRLLPLVAGTATVQYTPPANPAIDELVVALEDGSGDLGVEIGRLHLRVRGP